jgi:acetyl-CoA acetyltransferase
VDVIELHDSTAFAELRAYEELGLCGVGEGGRFAESGATALGAASPVNVSGGLESKGHPLAATGLAMVAELHLQLTNGAGARQVRSARRGLFHNAGGQIGFDEALAVVGLLQRASL